MLNMVSLCSGLETELGEEKLKEELGKLLRELELEYLKEKSREISREILKAEGDDSAQDILLREIYDISKKIQYIENGKKT